MDEIKKLKMMLEGKAPIDPTSLTVQLPGETVVQERIVYRDSGNNKENNSELEEELKNKED